MESTGLDNFGGLSQEGGEAAKTSDFCISEVVGRGSLSEVSMGRGADPVGRGQLQPRSSLHFRCLWDSQVSCVEDAGAGSQHAGGSQSHRCGWEHPGKQCGMRKDVAENGSMKRYAEDEKPERDCEDGVGVRESPATVAPRKQGRRWHVHKVKCWEDKNVRAGNDLLDLVLRRWLMAAVGKTQVLCGK